LTPKITLLSALELGYQLDTGKKILGKTVALGILIRFSIGAHGALLDGLWGYEMAIFKENFPRAPTQIRRLIPGFGMGQLN